jgi:glycosyltransferase involved in cell wall biosynthesis
MNICYIISDIDKAVYFEQTALALRKEKVNLSFILINCSNKGLHTFLIENNFEVHTLENESLLKSGRAIIKCRAILKDMKVDSVHCHMAQANWIGLWGSKLAGVSQRIFTRHSGEPLFLHWKEKMIDKIQNRLATKIIAITKMIDELLEKQGVPASKRLLIPHGFQLELFRNPDLREVNRINTLYNPEEAYPVIGVNARWMKWKGIEYIIAAFKTIQESYPNAKLILFGGSPSADNFNNISKLLTSLPKSSYLNVSFESNVYALYSVMNIYVHVPINPTCEAFGQTYVEALAAGIPSIFTLSGVACEFIEHEKNALVVPFKNSSAIYESMIQLLENSELRNHIIQQGKQDVQELFSFNQYISNLVELYNE